jgi:hypothetical protein
MGEINPIGIGTLPWWPKKRLAKSLKNNGVRQLGFSEIPNNIYGKS